MSKTAKILITGGAGFIGSQLGESLVGAGHEVWLLDNLRYGHLDNLVRDGKTFGHFVARDIRERDLAPYFAGVDTVFHLAGISALPVCQSEPGEAFDVNVAGTANVLELARLAGVRRVIFSSTSAVYERSAGERHAESDPISPDLIYAQTKAAAEKVCEGYARNHGMDIVVCRFFNVYGPHQDMHRQSPPFTGYLARELCLGRRPVVFNRSAAKRDYIHASDVIALLEKMRVSQQTFHADIFNLGTGVGHSVPEICEQMAKISGRAVEPEFREAGQFWAGYPKLFEGRYPLSAQRVSEEVHKSAIADIAKTSSAFSWKPAMTMKAGLETVYRYAQKIFSPTKGRKAA